jgi:hypothetical protein
VISILQNLGATVYLSGPAAKNYIQPELFDQAGIRLEYKQYNYPEYEQLYPPFDPAVSVLDLLFMKGPSAKMYFESPKE